MSIYLFGVLRCFQHCTGHITTGSWKGRENQYILFVRVLYCKLPTNGKQLPAFPLEAMPGIEPRPQRWEARVLPLCHCDPKSNVKVGDFTLHSTSKVVLGQVLWICHLCMVRSVILYVTHKSALGLLFWIWPSQTPVILSLAKHTIVKGPFKNVK